MNIKILRLKIVFCILSIFCIHSEGQAQTKSWAEQIAESIMKVHADSLVVRPYVTHGPSEEKIELKQYNRSSAWNYEHAVLLKGFECLGQETGNPVYFNYIKKMMDVLVQPEGSIRTYDLLEYNLDHVTPGRTLLYLYHVTKETKYKNAAELLREQ